MDRFAVVERALRAAAPHALMDVATEALREHYDAVDAELRLADYGMRSLQLVEPVPLTTEPLPIHGSPQGRALRAPEPVVLTDRATGAVTVHLPVSARGDRLGVLSVTLPGGTDAAGLLPELAGLCEALGHEITVADRDTDLYQRARRATRLTVAAEMQWHLLPGHSFQRHEFALGAHLEPAYSTSGDNFDWSVSAEHLTVTVTNGMGEGVEAALLTNLAVGAMRNARRAGLGLADQAALTDQAVYAHYRGSAYVSSVLLRFELATGEVEIVEAGSPRAWLCRDAKVDNLVFDAQLPLGMFEDTHYVTEHFRVQPGDRLLLATDGVYEPLSRAAEPFGDHALARSLTANRLLPPSQVPSAVFRDLAVHRGEGPLQDDALVLCVDWYGPEGRDGAA
ncbi:PP2C family protein-serine/threonine phosphatase [Streptomyces smyrnaeus]|uniref:PP2C family protein-serine/threonine phosphatase n=1 Tax=Streptomyces TaxID=1883 RepID=UPI000C3F71DE|nr:MULTISPECIES: PP2C family protein-serine/threonine phosphatase [unclassified Streptomyces]MBQ0865986.1 serine/threonine-protein phosphatase [Streptomyces sp. RK75]MBQ1122931.1 serine/threonine-protein phosphatase [Streptomyces sp. B15]MBQ1162772.1 serine/threonine-protein phosphatase [Streptomyces sp. A73]